jgi:hypothetical protein
MPPHSLSRSYFADDGITGRYQPRTKHALHFDLLMHGVPRVIAGTTKETPRLRPTLFCEALRLRVLVWCHTYSHTHTRYTGLTSSNFYHLLAGFGRDLQKGVPVYDLFSNQKIEQSVICGNSLYHRSVPVYNYVEARHCDYLYRPRCNRGAHLTREKNVKVSIHPILCCRNGYVVVSNRI